MRRFPVKPGRRFPVLRTGAREYMKHQGDYDEWAFPKSHVACFMEMRLGKTMPNIRIVKKWSQKKSKVLARWKRCFPICVVAPVSVLETWEKELRLEGENYVVVHGKSFDKRVETTVREAFGGTGRTWVLINYDSLRCTPGLSDLPWFAVLLDESTLIKNPKAKISEVCTVGFRDVQHRVIMSGLPSPEGELDLYQQFKFLHGHMMGYRNYWEFRNSLFDIDGYEWTPKTRRPCQVCEKGEELGYPNPNPNCGECDGVGYFKFPAAQMIKEYTHKHAFFLTRLQAGIGSKRIIEPRYIGLTKDQQIAYSKAENQFIAELGDDGFTEELETDFTIVQRTWLARIAGGCMVDGTPKWPAKTNELVSLLKGELANQPVVVGFRFNSEIFAVETAMKKAGIPCATLTGDDSRDARKRKQEWFRTSGSKSRVILVQIKKVAQYGVDMSVADTMVLYSISYSCEEMSQFLDRIVHPTKKHPLLFLYLLSKGTIDEDVYKTVVSTGGKVYSAKQFMRIVKFNFEQRRERLKITV